MDSTIAEPREKPMKTGKEKRKRKHGRKKDCREPAIAEEKEQLYGFMEKGDIEEFPSTLEHRYSITGKKEQQGQYGIVHRLQDNFAADAVMRTADKSCDYLCALMDSGYTSRRIEEFAKSIGKVPIIDSHADRDGNKKEMDPAKAWRYRARTTVERTNSELKECFLPEKPYPRGKRGIFQMEMSILMLDIKKIAYLLRAKAEASLERHVCSLILFCSGLRSRFGMPSHIL